VTDASADAAKDTATKQAATIAESLKSLKLESLKTATGAIAYSRSAISRAARGNPGFGGPAGPGGPIGLGSVSAQIPLTATITEKDPDKLRTSVDAFIAKVTEAGGSANGDVDIDSPFTSSRAAMLAAADTARIDWIVTDDASPRREALRAALRKAKADAEALAKELGWEKITILSVSDGPSAVGGPEASFAAGRTPAGEVAISARVSIKCSR
jgi:uncharacterized protein DUF541